MKKKLKGLLSLWLAAALVLVAPAVPVMAEETTVSHGEHSNWTQECYSGNFYPFQGQYILTGDVGIQQSWSCSSEAIICLGGKKFLSMRDYIISVENGGNLTMDDCNGTGECSVPFKVTDGGRLNIKRGTYTENTTVTTGGAMNIQGGKYTGDINNDGGTCNIGVNAGSHTQVKIAQIISSGSVEEKIKGNFNLLNPTPNYYTYEDSYGDNITKVFAGWAVALNADDGGKIISDTNIESIYNCSWEKITSAYSGVWAEVSSGDIYLADRWADGYTVTYDYSDGSTAKKTVGVVSGQAITLETPTRTGYTFGGWKEDSSGQTYNDGDPFTPTANTTLTAQWTANQSSGSGGYTPPSNTPDWNSIKNNVSNAKDKDTVNIDLSKNTTVPGDIFDSIKGKDVTLVLDLGNGMSWKINGKSITADKVGDIDFSVNFDSKTIPVEVINKVSGERSTIRLSLAHDGPLGFEAILSVDLDAKNAGLYANLFYFNPETNELEFVGDDIITDKGVAEFTFTHASDYAIIIDKVSMDPNIHAKGTELKEKKTKAIYKVTKAGKTGGTVAYMGSTNKKATSIVIPATVTVDGITYKVTSVATNAFKNNKTVEKITIGKNVKKIGKKAFYGCKKLKSIVIKTTNLTAENIGSNAFKGIAAKATIKVPESKLDIYKELLKEKGLGDKAVVKK